MPSEEAEAGSAPGGDRRASRKFCKINAAATWSTTSRWAGKGVSGGVQAAVRLGGSKALLPEMSGEGEGVGSLRQGLTSQDM